MADYYGKWKGGRLVVWGRVDDGKEELWNPNDLAYQPGPVLDAIFGEDAEPEWGPIAEAAAKAAEQFGRDRQAALSGLGDRMAEGLFDESEDKGSNPPEDRSNGDDINWALVVPETREMLRLNPQNKKRPRRAKT
ncbi:hypothetical protein FB106_12032 [Synechococcus sp. Ace-Pa]|uniref:hypothetical protein n=2 Tax=Synechococcus sp. Ace-Pa TaxID=2572902 RepID=UPI0011A554BC|nr:hypothetical protein [Synechococcus sp. Ace-Pa]MCT4364790.1 hypothetical protein [Candidatus Regnicoccus frigidus MAG-AL1]TWB87697.1 hypothetical protein FB106_12032 [Synechococcus sp. Ace-Pa]